MLFSAVVKNIASPSLPIKRLVYIYLIQYAESEPDTALLAINTIQKSLSAPEPQVRALALRVMSSLRLPVISQIVTLAIKKGIADMSPLVRRTAALAIPKCWRLDPNTSTTLLEYLTQLLGDRQQSVAGAAAIAFMEVCPDRIDLVHKHYRSLVRKLVDMDDWSQLAVLRLMTSYGRQCFPLRTHRVRKGQVQTTASFYGDDKDDKDDEAEGNYEEQQILDPDLSLLLNGVKPLLYSRNSAVVLSVAHLYLYLTPSTSIFLESSVGPLVALLRTPPANAELALSSIVQVALSIPSSFTKYLTHYLPHARDSPRIRASKLELLTIVFPYASSHGQSLILSELSHSASSSPNSLLVREAVRALGRCAQSSATSSTTANRCLRLLLGQLASPDPDLVAESLTVIRHLIQANPVAHTTTVTRLAKNLDTITSPAARASTIWLIGEFAGLETSDGTGNIAADVLRILVKGFADESVEAKLQIVSLAAKVQLHTLNRLHAYQPSEEEKNQDATTQDPKELETEGSAEVTTQRTPPPAPEPDAETIRISQLWTHVLLLSRYDTSYDLRDRARLYRALLSNPTSTQLASLLLLAPKPVPSAPSPSDHSRNFALGTASAVLGGDVTGANGLPGYSSIPQWVEHGHEPDPALRQGESEGIGEVGIALSSAADRLSDVVGPQRDMGIPEIGAGGAGPKIAEVNLDDWLDESEEDESEESEEEEESEDEETDEETEEETDEEDNGEQSRLVS